MEVFIECLLMLNIIFGSGQIESKKITPEQFQKIQQVHLTLNRISLRNPKYELVERKLKQQLIGILDDLED